MDLVTVTCKRDLNQMILQSHSIDVFIAQPCIHWVIIEDPKLSTLECYTKLSKFYARHTLKILRAEFLIGHNHVALEKSSGWVRQQALKFLIALLIKSSTYLILDSKNFFIKPTSLKKWPVSNGNHIVKSILTDKTHCNWLKQFSKKFNLNFSYSTCEPVTPFRVNTRLVKQLNELGLTDAFDTSNQDPSEFKLYCLYSQSQGFNIPYGPGCGITYWERSIIESKSDEIFNNALISPFVATLGVHRTALSKNKKEISFFVSWLANLGLEDSIIEAGLTSSEI
jgi:uncharacterized membrane protein